MSKLERKRNDRTRLALLVCELDDVWVASQEVDDVVGFVFAKEIGADEGSVGWDLNVGVLSLDRGETDVSVLNVDTRK